MPKILLGVPETTESVTRPVALDIIRQVLKVTGIDSNVNVVFPGDTNNTQQLNSAISQQTGDDPNKFDHNNKISIEIQEVDDPDQVQNEAVFRPENLLIFEDPPLDVIMKPVYSAQAVTITVKYRAENKNLAIKWRDAVKAKIGMARDIYIHDISYSYGVPKEFLIVLEEIHKMRENVAGYGDTFDEYFASHRHPKMTNVTNLAGTSELWVMPETQDRVQGWFDFELPEEGSKEDASNTWTISFSYKYHYRRPTAVAMMYPLVIHNQVVPPRIREVKRLTSYEDRQHVHSYFTGSLLPLEGGTEAREYCKRFGYSIPTWDEFSPSQIPISSLRVLEILTLVDEANPALLFNLGELGDRKFTPEILAYLKAEHAWLDKPFGSAIHLSMYRNQYLISPTPLVVTADLDVLATTPPNLRTQLHVRVGLLTNLQMIQGKGLERMQDHGKAVHQMLMAIDPTMERRGALPRIVGDDFITKRDLINAITQLRPSNPQGGIYSFNTVQYLVIESKPSTALPKK